MTFLTSLLLTIIIGWLVIAAIIILWHTFEILSSRITGHSDSIIYNNYHYTQNTEFNRK